MKKITSLQAVKGIAIILIMVSHCRELYISPDGNNRLNWFGAFGVSLFIMLSGYLAILKSYNYKNIMPVENIKENILLNLKRKIKKIYPLHIITLLLALPLSFSIFSENFIKGIISFIASVMMVQGWIPIRSVYFGFNLVSWYLTLFIFFGVAEFFVIRFLKRKSGTELYIIIIFTFIFELLLYVILPNHWLIYICPVTRLLDYITGGCIACIKSKELNNKNILNKKIFILMLIITISMLVFSMYNKVIKYEFFLTLAWFLPSICFIYFATGSQELGKAGKFIFQNKFFIFIGNISMEIFLLHHLIIRYVGMLWINMEISNIWIMYIVALFISVMAAFIIHNLHSSGERK